jgi:serine/threonine-protein kinase HipA
MLGVAECPVFYEAHRVGTIEVHDDGPWFFYDSAWLDASGAFPISISMPLSVCRVAPRIFEPWAAGLLPAAPQLKVVAEQLGMAAEDTIAILQRIGTDTAGALSIGRPCSTRPGDWRPVPDEAASERLINELPQKPLLAGEEGVSMTLAGARSKLPVAIGADGRIAIPRDGAPSTHVLKLDSEHLFGGVQNEALCMVLARRCGLSAPAAITGKAGSRNYLLVPRYDRIEQTGRWRRLHQETFFQALGGASAAKSGVSYDGAVEPTLADMLSLTRGTMCAPDVLSLIDYFILNIVVCNPNSHAGRCPDDLGQARRPRPDLRPCVCSRLGRHFRQARSDGRGRAHRCAPMETFAAECSLNPGRLLARVSRLA